MTRALPVDAATPVVYCHENLAADIIGIERPELRWATGKPLTEAELACYNGSRAHRRRAAHMLRRGLRDAQ